MHTYMRPHGSRAEGLFIRRFLWDLPGLTVDVYGNYHVIQGDSSIVWSCHTDTVHRSEGRQTVHYDPQSTILSLSRRSKRLSTCLGADDTAGVFICAGMVLAGVPGHYIFHYGEESGGIGSGNLARMAPELVQGATHAIAFDRRGTSDIVTHQWSTRTASDAFAASLGTELARVDSRLAYKGHTGVYTDTAEYADIIGECSNLSVGYQDEHSIRETLNTSHTLRLLAAMCRLDQSTLVQVRQPGEIDPADDWDFNYRQGSLVASTTVDVDDLFCGFCGHEWHKGECDCGCYALAPSRSFCMDCDEQITPGVTHHCPVTDTSSTDCYLDRVYRDVQSALKARKDH